MKHFYLSVLFLLFSSISYAQTVGPDQEYYARYSYDSAGNRVAKTIIVGTSPKLKSKAAPGMDEDDTETFIDRIGEAEIKIYPNPTKGNLVVEINNIGENANSYVSLLDTQGKLLRKETVTDGLSFLDLTHFINGTYILKIYIDGKTTVWKIIKE